MHVHISTKSVILLKHRVMTSMYCSVAEFERLCQQWGANEWAWLTAFRADMMLFKVTICLLYHSHKSLWVICRR